MAEQALLPRNRMQSNKAQQWLPAKGCALLHKDTLGPVCWIRNATFEFYTQQKYSLAVKGK